MGRLQKDYKAIMEFLDKNKKEVESVRKDFDKYSNQFNSKIKTILESL